jgi:uncharacterized repeat protein (TIGR03803 family)
MRIAGATLLAGPLPASVHAATTILHNFDFSVSNGATPSGSLTLSGSTLYGMTEQGGSSLVYGTIFRMNTDGTGFELLHSFTGGVSDGGQPLGSLTLSDSTFYGMTFSGGSNDSGTLFSMNIDGTGFDLLHSFIGGANDGSRPYGSLTLSGSTLYGMTREGGNGDRGTIFSMDIDGTGFTLLHTFTGGASDGVLPFGSLTLSGSTLYGMTEGGGSGNGGALFRINTDGTSFALLKSFAGAGGGFDSEGPSGSLTLSNSTLFGMSTHGGSSHRGALFSMNTDGTGYSLLHSFTGGVSDGALPDGSLTLSGSTLYGMTADGGSSGNGAIFAVNTDGTGYGLLASFDGAPADGAHPRRGDLTISSDGSTLYGMTYQGGPADAGVVFSAPAPEPGAFALLGLGALLLTARRHNARV